MTSIKNNISTFSQVILFCYMPLAFCCIIYWPGLSGPFIFDDIVNFQTLLQLDRSNTFNRIYQFILTGNAGPLGRPISLLSFMINDNSWPSNPWSFKYTNMLIHMLNGVLIFIVCLQLSRYTSSAKKYRFVFAGIATTIWLLHPMQTSTVLYVIQRMTQLSTLFTLASIICFLHGRYLLAQPREINKAYWIMSLGIIFFGLLAIFSKENGILLIFFIGTIEYTLLKNAAAPASYRFWKITFIILPSIFLIAGLIFKFPDFLHAYSVRDFTMYERVLSEARILCDYIFKIFIPRSGGSGLFHDDYIKSTSLFSPPQTIAAIAVILALLISAFYIRNRSPITSFSILWFFSGHILESTIAPLELYFEHRNYLPLLGPAILIAALGTSAITSKRNYYYKLPVVIYIILISFITFHNNRIWGNHILIAKVWATEKPNSIRAQQSASAISVMMGDHKKARSYIANIYKKYPDEAALLLQLLQLDCNTGQLSEKQLERAAHALSNKKYSHATIPTIINLYEQIERKTCANLTLDSLLNIIESLIKNESFNSAPTLHALHYWKGVIYADKRLLSPAIESLDMANEYQGVIDIPLQQAIWLASAGLYQDALTYVHKAEIMDKRARNPLLRNARKKDINNLKTLIINASKSNAS